jgi:hypothetical protein
VLPNQYLMNRLLRRLAREYPNRVEISTLEDLDTPEAQRALFYLAEQGLVAPGFISERPGQPREMLEATITARGLEKVQGEAEPPSQQPGLPLPFEMEALRHFLKRSIESSTLPETVKQESAERLMAFSDDDVKFLVIRLIQKVAEDPKVIAHLIKSYRA